MRCSRCLMPSSIPGISFNEDRECIWCQIGYPNYTPQGSEALRDVLNKNRNKKGGTDCLVAVSGGKDSCYALLKLKLDYGIRIEAFTYVHDGLDDFALENAQEVCRELDIPHHIVSLPKHRHLKSFKAYFIAWLQGEEPLAAAMTCVACKHLHILGARLASERNIPMILYASCPLEYPPFVPTQLEKGADNSSKRLISLGREFVRKLITCPELDFG